MTTVQELHDEPAGAPLHGMWTKGGPVFSHLPAARVQKIEGRAIASFGDAVTLGMWFVTDNAGGGWAEAGRIGGYFFFAAGFFACYGGTALLINTAWRRELLAIGGRA